MMTIEELNEIYFENPIIGFFQLGDFYRLNDIVDKLPDEGTIVHVGTYFGRSASLLADLFRSKNKKYKIVCLDTYDNVPALVAEQYNSNVGLTGDISTISNFLLGVQSNIDSARENLKDYLEIECHVYDIFKNKPQELNLSNVVCVFDDSVHSEAGVTQVFNDWYPVLEEKGIYCGHDYSETFMEVFNTVNRLVEENNVELQLPTAGSSVFHFIKESKTNGK